MQELAEVETRLVNSGDRQLFHCYRTLHELQMVRPVFGHFANGHFTNRHFANRRFAS